MQYIEYVQTDGACWFDTGIIPDLSTKVELALTPITQRNYPWLVFIGAQNNDDSSDTFQIRRNNRNNNFEPKVDSQYTNVDYTQDTRYELSLDKDNFVVNGDSYSIGATSMDACNYTLFISAVHNPIWETGGNGSGVPYRASSAKFEEIKIYKNNVLVGDFRPANNNGSIGFYDTISQTFKANLGTGTPVAGPSLSSIIATASKTSLAATGETINISVSCENAWTSTQTGEWLTLSSTGDTGGTTITATAPSYSGATARETTITFLDTTTNDTAVITIKQKKYTSGQPVYLGGNEVTELYLGETAIAEAYLGENLVYSSGPFQGLKISPRSISFNPESLTANLKIKSSESWAITLPAWVGASSTSGNSGETTITLTATAQTANTSGSIVVTSSTYTASGAVSYSLGTPYIDVIGKLGIVTDFYVGQFYRNDNYIKFEVAVKGSATTTNKTYLYETNPTSPWFSMEGFVTNNHPYVNMASTTGALNGSTGGNGLDHPWTIIVDNGSGESIIDGATAQRKNISGNWPADNTPLIFFGTNSTNTRTRFYYMKIWDRSGNLVKHFVPDPSGSIKDLVSGTVYSITDTGSSTYGLELN